MRPTKLTEPFLDQRRIGKAPAVDRTVVNFEPALLEHFFQVAIAQRIAQIPSDRLHDQPRLEIPPFEIVFQLPLQLFGNSESWLRSATLDAEFPQVC